MSRVTEPPLPDVLLQAYERYGDPRTITGCSDASPGVSTNRVFRLDLSLAGRPAGRIFAKVSSYGSYVHFRQDHERIARFIELLRGSRYETLHAPVLSKEGRVFTHEGVGADAGTWVVFYGEVARRSPMPKVLPEHDIAELGREMARLHQHCDALRGELDPTWKTLGSDIAILYDQLSEQPFCRERGLDTAATALLKSHCDRFLESAEHLGYHRFHRLPVMIDWNRGNFSVQRHEEGFQLYSRWDYDWFRIEPRTLDFYFCSRVVRDEGDQTTFSYLLGPLLEPRFSLFLSAYHEIFPLSHRELLFVRETYRFFILNYVVRVGQHFFVPSVYHRLLREAVELYLPSIDRADFELLARGLD
jgi:hypothetical protein